MDNKLLWKFLIIVVLTLGAAYMLYPNAVWYSQTLPERQEQARRKNPLAKKVIPLGLDLQGGVHLVYQMDISKLPDVADETIRRAMEQNKMVINNRIDGLGVANAFVASQGRDLIMIQLPGIYQSEDAKQIIGKTALLEFRMVKEDNALVTLIEKIHERNLQMDDLVTKGLPEDLKPLVPQGLELLPMKGGGYVLVKDTPDLTGKYLKRAWVSQGVPGQFISRAVDFELDSEGAALFEALTGANIGERLAIVLDGLIQSAPVIQSRIRGSGQITGIDSDNEAKLVANVLNSGNLQAPMKVVEERTVGPELGEDSIQAGIRSVAIAFVWIVVFMAIYYRFSGVLAGMGLVLNLVYLMAAMAMIRATLTLPGIAGIILSLAMAVDANVLIFERIREELTKGKQPKFALEEGYSKAFSAILDGNLTTFFAAVFLFQFGSLPLKGFAITLMIGLVISMLTAVWVTKTFYEVWFSIRKPSNLSV